MCEGQPQDFWQADFWGYVLATAVFQVLYPPVNKTGAEL
jgi:hypothetical protein